MRMHRGGAAGSKRDRKTSMTLMQKRYSMITGRRQFLEMYTEDSDLCPNLSSSPICLCSKMSSLISRRSVSEAQAKRRNFNVDLEHRSTSFFFFFHNQKDILAVLLSISQSAASYHRFFVLTLLSTWPKVSAQAPKNPIGQNCGPKFSDP